MHAIQVRLGSKLYHDHDPLSLQNRRSTRAVHKYLVRHTKAGYGLVEAANHLMCQGMIYCMDWTLMQHIESCPSSQANNGSGNN